MNSGECRVGTIENCERYRSQEDACDACEEGYYPSGTGNECLENTFTDDLCIEWDGERSNKCAKCQGNAFKFRMMNMCKSVLNDFNSNCIKWKNYYQCLECDEGYYLTNYDQ